jgi:pseudouridine-5'-phosphate glycosidase
MSFSTSTTATNLLPKYLNIQPEVEQAIEAGRPVVALESTIVAHGMPFPENLELAREVENILRSKVHD